MEGKGRGREGKGREEKGREGKGKGRERKGREGIPVGFVLYANSSRAMRQHCSHKRGRNIFLFHCKFLPLFSTKDGDDMIL